MVSEYTLYLGQDDGTTLRRVIEAETLADAIAEAESATGLLVYAGFAGVS